MEGYYSVSFPFWDYLFGTVRNRVEKQGRPAGIRETN
jgi:sterol desaturase/sphingolipid hydroxylase (fatty acid hydroxylase superfamily)